MLYILLVFILIHTFFDFRPDFPLDASGLRLNRSSSFQGLPPVNQRDSFFRITPPMASLESVGRFSRRPSNFSRISSSHKSQKDKPSRSSPPTSRRANPSRLSALLVPRRSSGRFAPPQSPDDVDRLWNQDEAEKGMSPHVTFDSQEVDIPPPRSSSELSPPGPKESARWQDPVFTSVLREASGDVPQSVSPRSSFPLPTLAIPPRALSRAEMPVAGYSESPIYGLHGVVRGQMSPSAFPSPPVMQSLRRDGSDSPSEGTRSSISYLLRQQAELDKSIANLRLLTQSESLTATRRGSETSSESKIPSAAQSEFSLSNFPEPPWGLSRVEAEITRRTGGFPTVAALRQAATLRTANNEPPAPAPSEPLPPPPPIGGAEHSRTLSLPYSDNGESSIMGRDRSKFDSQGTQFEITSFIGGKLRFEQNYLFGT